MDTGQAQIPPIRQISRNQDHRPDSPTLLKYPEAGIYQEPNSTLEPPKTRHGRDSNQGPVRRPSRRHFQPRFHVGDHLAPEGDSGKSSLSVTTSSDIIQSKWQYDTEDRDREKVFLTTKTLADSTDFHQSFRWIHHQRVVSAIKFSDFEDAIGSMPGLYEEEMAVAMKCLQEAKSARKTSAMGRYFDQTLYQTKTVLQNGGDATPIQATFFSMPVFALFPDQSLPGEKGVYPSSRDIRSSDRHPIRSLLQSSNILAIDGERDRQQVIFKTGARHTDMSSFVHVPEMWALIINMYTIVTCAPFSIQELCGDNVTLGTEEGTSKAQEERRIIVKYTDLKGTLRDFQIRTWPGLLDSIARHEDRPELITMLMDPGSDYKIVDLNFKPLDRTTWNDIVEGQRERTNYVHLRLLRVLDSDLLNLQLAERKRQSYFVTTFGFLAMTFVLQYLQKKLARSRQDFFKQDVAEIQRLKRRIDAVKKDAHDLWRSRNRNRLLLYATKYYLLHPEERHRRYRWHPTTKGSSEKAGSNSAAQERDFKKPARSYSSDPKLESSPKLSAQAQTPSIVVSPSSPTQTSVKLDVPAIEHPKVPIIPQIVIGGEDDDTKAPDAILPPSLDPDDELSLARVSSLPQTTQTSPTVVVSKPKMQINVDIEAQHSPERTGSHRWSRMRRSSVTAFDAQPIHAGKALDSLMNDPILAVGQRQSHRRHSMAELQDVERPVVLNANPPRRPTGMAEPRLYLVSSNPQDASKSADIEAAMRHSFVHTPRPPMLETPMAETPPTTAHWNLRDLASDHISGAVAQLHPFFEWRSSNSKEQPRASTNAEKLDPSVSIAENGEMRSEHSYRRDSSSGDGSRTLDFIDRQLKSDTTYQRPLGKTPMPFGASFYEKTSPKTVDDVIALLEAEHRKVAPDDYSSLDSRQELKADPLVHEWKVEFFLGVYGLLRCFVHHEKQSSEAFQKIWGIVYDVCALADRPEQSLVYPKRHELQYIRVASLHLRETGEGCRLMLEDVWPEIDAGDESRWEHAFPQALEFAFQSIIVYLLCIHHAATRYGLEAPDIESARNQIWNFFQDAEVELVQMRVLRDTTDRAMTAESIRTAETLLGLLLENALEICNAEPVDSQQLLLSPTPHFDLRHVYSKYTSSCITRAKREATARVYKDIRLLLEEIDTVTRILKQQKKLFVDVTKKRESAKQLLDLRLNRRTLGQFDDMIEHFEKLHGLAKQAEFWARHSIDVRGEDTNKYLYVFTAVTVIFLPLSFVAGLLGMNTWEIRNTKDGQWLFWAVAIPFTISVLIVCLLIANVRMKKKTNAVVRSFVGWCGRRVRGL